MALRVVVLAATAAIAIAGSCSGSDAQIWSQKGSAAFSGDLDACGHQCALSSTDCASKCVQGKEGYSDGCASCFGDIFGCTRQHCKLKCIGGQTDACKQCVKDAGCVATFTSCSGFTPPSVSVQGNQCSDNDSQIWTQKGLAAFSGDLDACGHQCALSSTDCASKCVQGKEGYSDGCASCFGDIFGCTRQHCKLKCIGGQTDECKQCVKDAGCVATFTSCSGFTPPSVSVQGNQCSDNDSQIWSQKGLAAFSGDLDACGHQCALSSTDCASKCVQGKEGYSDGCASCFGDIFGCTRQHCKLKCIGGQTDACKQCVKDAGCVATFTSCSGFTPPSVSVQGNQCSDNDSQIWSQKGLAAFSGDLDACGHQCALSSTDCASKCVQGKEGYSDGCASCFGDIFGCTRQHCKLKCIGGQTDACKQCVKDAGCVATFTSCSGFTPPSVSVQGNQCSDNDSQIWSQKGLAAFSGDLDACGHQCALSSTDCASKCVQGKEGYSDGCASCFGDIFGCTRQHCKLKCIGGQTDECKQCVKDAGCVATFTSCSGFTPPSVSVQGNQCSDNDSQIWSQKGLAAFSGDLDACGHQCALSSTDCASKCVQGKEGYSDGCASCFGDVFGCTRQHCKLKCIGGQTPACKQCVKDAGCVASFTGCSGFTPPSLVSATCTGSADPTPNACYQGSARVLALKEDVHVKVDSFSANQGTMDFVGSGPKAISCLGKAFQKNGQSITTDLSDCCPDLLKLSGIKYCSDQDMVIVDAEVASLHEEIQLTKVTCDATIVV
ncbi:unnamed protein product [Effrenium voratum]|nr:unnamed protein product [Effrenium voratum]